MLPEAFIERFKQIVPLAGDINACFTSKTCRSFRINTLKTTREAAAAGIKRMGIMVQEVPWYPDAFVVSMSDAQLLLDSPLRHEGHIYAQGLESMLAPLVLDPKPGWTVLDLCAAPGSKTTQIAALMGNRGTIYANEPVRNRHFRLKTVAELMGAEVKLTAKDGRFFKGEAVFDGILVDAPCSSEGRFCLDNPKSYAFWSVRKVREMAHKQKGLLLNASRLLKKGGTLVYATCTFSPEENEEVVMWFLKKTAGDFKLVPVDLPEVVTYQSSLPACVRVMPGAQMEGFFLAKFSS